MIVLEDKIFYNIIFGPLVTSEMKNQETGRFVSFIGWIKVMTQKLLKFLIFTLVVLAEFLS